MEACETRMVQTLKDLARDTDLSDSAAVLLEAPARAARERGLRLALQATLGVDLTAVPAIGVETALTIASEIGPDLSRFPSSEHFCSWLALAPGTRVSGGKTLKGRAPKRVNRVGQALRLAASTARHNRSFIGACHRARLRRLDRPRAIKATAYQLARLIYAMLTRGETYVEKGIEQFECERRDRQLRHLKHEARRFNLTLVEAAPPDAAQAA